MTLSTERKQLHNSTHRELFLDKNVAGREIPNIVVDQSGVAILKNSDLRDLVLKI